MKEPDFIPTEPPHERGPLDDDGPADPFQGQEEVETVASFDPRHREPFEGLAYLGRLTGSLEFAGHTFFVRTLMPGEKLEVASVCRPWDGTQGFARAYRAAVAAAGLVSADGQGIPVAERSRGVVEQRFEWVIRTWHDPVVDALYEKINELEGRVIEILIELGAYGDKREAAIVPGGAGDGG